MREGPSSEVLAGAAGWGPAAASWRDGDLLAGDIPIISGRLVVTGRSKVPERLTFTVPEASTVDGRWVSWVPQDPTHPLARYGQTIELSIVVRSAMTGAETVTRVGRYDVQDWSHDDVAGTVEVTCFGVLHRAVEARFRAPQVPRAGSTLGSEFRRLMVPGVPVVIDDALTDRRCPTSFVWETERIDALYEIADAWPARLLTDQHGQVTLRPPLPQVPDPVLRFTDGVRGTVVSAPRSDTRQDAANVVVGTSSATDSPARESVRAVVEQLSGPMAVTRDGTGYREVVRYVSSPLVTTEAQVRSMATKTLADEQRPAVVRRVRAAPDPRVELDDGVLVTRGEAAPELGWVVGYELPLTVRDGAMTVDVGIAF